MAKDLKPRLCCMSKGENGYGFHLHGEKGKSGQFIRKVEANSPAEAAGMHAGDRVVEVNGVNVEKETHHQVVQRIKALEKETRLLVVDKETDEFLRGLSLACTEEMARSGVSIPEPVPVPQASVKGNGAVSRVQRLSRRHSAENRKKELPVTIGCDIAWIRTCDLQAMGHIRAERLYWMRHLGAPPCIFLNKGFRGVPL
ncbi:UNVERIFIED_CONTAM: hypothetical protein FKN15_030948 [Acipenser sinensis]